MSVVAWDNWFVKHRFLLTQRMLANLEGFHGGPELSGQDALRMQEKLRADMNEDSTRWRGWWARHDYDLRFLGDDVATVSTAMGTRLEILLVAVFAGLIAVLWRTMTPRPRPAPVPLPAAEPAVKSAKKGAGSETAGGR
jgi:hypothetical protein